MSEQPPGNLPPSVPAWGLTILPTDEVGNGSSADRPRNARRGLLIGAVATVVAVTAGVGAYAAMQLRGGGRQPESLAPASAFAFAKVDLDPTAGQKLAVRELATKFPSAPQGEIEEIFDGFLRKALQDDDDVDFDRDINPWLGDRIGIAGFAGAGGSPSVLGIIRSKDDDKARPALARLAASADAGAAYLLRDGYVLVGPEQRSLDLAVAALEDGSLGDTDRFADDVDALSGDQIITAWADVKRSYEIAETALPPDASPLPMRLRDRLRGRVVIGVHAARDFIEIEGLTIDGDMESLAGAPATLLGELPASTVAAVSAAGVRKQVDEALDAFGAFPELPSRAELAEQATATLGLDLEEDLLPLFGQQLVLALGEVPDLQSGGLPDLGLLSLVTDPARAGKSASRIQEIAVREGTSMRARVVGNTFYLTSDDDYLKTLTKDGPKLADSPRFRRAVGDLDDDVAFVAYVDLRELLTLMKGEEGYDDVRALASVGMRAGLRDGNGYVRLRVVVE